MLLIISEPHCHCQLEVEPRRFVSQSDSEASREHLASSFGDDCTYAHRSSKYVRNRPDEREQVQAVELVL